MISTQRSAVFGPSVPSQPERSQSWLSLLSRTTLGPGSSVVRVSVKTFSFLIPPAPSNPLRLVVQLFPRCAMRRGRSLPSARPLASAVRAVQSFAQGWSVPLAGFCRDGAFVGGVVVDGNRDCLVAVAWVEAGLANLELDGALAVPSPGSCYGSSLVSSCQDSVVVELRSFYREESFRGRSCVSGGGTFRQASL